MEKKKGYPLIDGFRIVAAILIVAIHISPLSNVSNTADLVLCRAVGRLAVPFFIMTSGFFLFRENCDLKKLLSFVKKTLLIYLAAVILYLPVNIYNGYFTETAPLEIIKDVLVDGTFYHLWYLPAAACGAVIAWLLLKLGDKAAVLIALVLYLVGLFGDSYYELTGAVKPFYDFIFIFTDYTRCGLFMTPIFFILGRLAKGKSAPLRDTLLFFGFLALLITEELLLSHFGLQRHDSMFFALLPASFFLFRALCSVKGERTAIVAPAALILYIIHPLVIIAVRLAAKLTGLTSTVVDDPLVLFFAVAAVSLAVSFLIAFLFLKIKKRFKK